MINMMETGEYQGCRNPILLETHLKVVGKGRSSEVFSFRLAGCGEGEVNGRKLVAIEGNQRCSVGSKEVLEEPKQEVPHFKFFVIVGWGGQRTGRGWARDEQGSGPGRGWTGDGRYGQGKAGLGREWAKDRERMDRGWTRNRLRSGRAG